MAASECKGRLGFILCVKQSAKTHRQSDTITVEQLQTPMVSSTARIS